MENENVKVKKSNKGVVIVLIIIVLGLCSYIVYDKFITKEEPNTNDTTQTTTTDTTKNDNTVVESKEEEVPVTDLSAFAIYASESGASYVYCYVLDGTLYYTGANEDYAIGASGKEFSTFTKEESLTNIKRIKVFNEGTSVNPYLFAITEDGKVYSSSMHTGNIKFEQLKGLDNYQIDDLLSYRMNIPDGDSNASADYKVILKDGTTKDIHITY